MVDFEAIERKKLIEDFIEKNNVKRYQHGERPEGEEPVIPNAWRRSKIKPKVEEQAEIDALNGKG